MNRRNTEMEQQRGGSSNFGNSVQELVYDANSPKKRHRQSLLIIVAIVILLVAAVIIVIAVLRSDTSNPASSDLRLGEQITDEEIFTKHFSPHTFNGTWISGNEFIYEDGNSSVLSYSVTSGKVEVLVPNSVMDSLRVSEFIPSPDGQYILLIHNIQKVYRYSFIALHTIYNVETGDTFPLGPPPHLTEDLHLKKNVQLPLQHAIWAPVGNTIAFVFQNDIFYRQNVMGPTYQLTATGVLNTVYNGIPDWVYEEEILSSPNAMWFSKDGNMLAFATFNDTDVNIMQFPYYGQLHTEQSQYPLQLEIRYPKPGRVNPTVDVFMLDLTEITFHKGTLKRALPPDEFRRKDHYFTTIGWIDETNLSVIWMNRHQNKSIVSICSALDGTCKEVQVVTESHGWTDLYTSPLFSRDGSQYLLILPEIQNSGQKFKHVSAVGRSDRQVTALTSGAFVVTTILFWDEDNGYIYFIGSQEGKTGQRHLYRVSYPSSKIPGNQTCLTCDLRNAANEPCTYNSVEFSKDHSHYILSCNGQGIPEVTIWNLQGKKLKVWENNAMIREQISRKALPLTENLEVDVEGGYKAHVRMYLPPSFSPNKKYPLFVNVYAGPGSQIVNDKWRVGWSDYLVTKREVVYAIIDGRGSGMQGDELLFELYYRLGSVEVEDQIRVTKYLQDNFPYIDKSRTGIWGWSYGGYVTAMVLATDVNNVFQCGVSVAPVTNWLYYDTVYSERYLGLPTPNDNLIGYNNSDVTSQVENFKNKLFYLIHGTGDDNVHYQQSMMLSKALEKADILFRQQSYPDENHSIAGLKKHLYHSIENFLGECLGFDS